MSFIKVLGIGFGGCFGLGFFIWMFSAMLSPVTSENYAVGSRQSTTSAASTSSPSLLKQKSGQEESVKKATDKLGVNESALFIENVKQELPYGFDTFILFDGASVKATPEVINAIANKWCAMSGVEIQNALLEAFGVDGAMQSAGIFFTVRIGSIAYRRVCRDYEYQKKFDDAIRVVTTPQNSRLIDSIRY